MKATAGAWDRKAWPVYFIAGNIKHLGMASAFHDHLLVAVNEIGSDADLADVSRFIDAGNRVLIDSGVFNLSTAHAEAHGISMDEALGMAPDEVDGFDELLAAYVALIQRFGAQCWGYIEIDQGGRDNKIRTRARLEAMGLAPIPVYHPFNDGWDYFDHLAQRYDRICFGNVVQADPATRKRLVATAWERRRRYPDLWIHLLGLTASEQTLAYPCNSCDSSTWLSAVRWGAHDALVANSRAWSTGSALCYRRGAAADAPAGYNRAIRLGAYDSAIVARTITRVAADQRRALGCDVALPETRR